MKSVFLISLLWCAVVCFSTAFAADLPIQTNNKMYVTLPVKEPFRKVLTQYRLAFIDPDINGVRFFDKFKSSIQWKNKVFSKMRKFCEYQTLPLEESVLLLSDCTSLAVIKDMFDKSNLADDTKKLIRELLKKGLYIQQKLSNKSRKIELTQKTLKVLQGLVCFFYRPSYDSQPEGDMVKYYEEQMLQQWVYIGQEEIEENEKQLKEPYLTIAGCIFLGICIPFTYSDNLKKGKIKEWCLKALMGCLILGSIATDTFRDVQKISGRNHDINIWIQQNDPPLISVDSWFPDENSNQSQQPEDNLGDTDK